MSFFFLTTYLAAKYIFLRDELALKENVFFKKALNANLRKFVSFKELGNQSTVIFCESVQVMQLN